MGGDADAAGLSELLGVLIGQQRAPDLQRAAAAVRPIAVDAVGHLLEHRVEEHRLEVAGGGLRLVFDLEGGLNLPGRRIADRVQRSTEVGYACHHITSMSAWIAPAALIACRIVMRSRGPMPSALSPSTICCSETPSWTSASLLPSSCTATEDRGTTTVRPRENGPGWLTCGASEIVTVRLPCATATVETRTSRPMTMTPERSSMTILAAISGSTCNCSISVSIATTFCGYFFGSVSCTVDGSSGWATGAPI